MKNFRRVLTITLLAAATISAIAGRPGPSQSSGFIVLAEHRFDPAIQRFMADRSLKLLPLGNGQLYFVYPRNIDPRLEQIQIRYLEQLIDKNKKVEPKAE